MFAIGEGAHFVEEFSRARQRVLRFLAERCGFNVFAMEFGFSEAFPLDRWLQGLVSAAHAFGTLHRLARTPRETALA